MSLERSIQVLEDAIAMLKAPEVSDEAASYVKKGRYVLTGSVRCPEPKEYFWDHRSLKVEQAQHRFKFDRFPIMEREDGEE